MVPQLVGLTAITAHDAALDANLLAVDQDPVHRPSVQGIVTAQDPLPGSRIPTGGTVRIWVTRPEDEGPDDGGRGGSKLPQGPTSPLRTGAK